MGLRLRVSVASAAEGRKVGCCKMVGIFILNGIHLSHKQKKKTYFDYDAEDDTSEQ